MTTPQTDQAQHTWQEIRVTRVEIIDGVAIGLEEPEIVIGCFTCNMGLEEGLTLPCPGIDIEDMMT